MSDAIRVAIIGAESTGKTTLAAELASHLASQGLQTAVYSRLIFGDHSLDELAVRQQRGMALTLLTALDLPWVADGHQRDGPQVRRPVDDLLRELLLAHRLPFAVVGGQGVSRLNQAAAALAPLLREPTRLRQ